jgi:hypothetical protein
LREEDCQRLGGSLDSKHVLSDCPANADVPGTLREEHAVGGNATITGQSFIGVGPLDQGRSVRWMGYFFSFRSNCLTSESPRNPIGTGLGRFGGLV